MMDSLRLTLSGLAHDSMRGRGSGTEDELRAAAFMNQRFRAYGLDPPLGGSPRAFQAFSPRLSEVVSSQNVLAAIPGSRGCWAAGILPLRQA